MIKKEILRILYIYYSLKIFKKTQPMKLKLLLTIVLLPMISVFSQTDFESGYFIQNDGTKTECLIKNEDWRGSPKTFEYKFGENGEIKLGSLENIKEFGSAESFKYVKATVDIDQSTDVVNNLTDDRNPVMKKETLFIKTLAEGKATLYYTEKENIKRYFFKVADGKIEQLIYKRYLITSAKMGTNERYKQQLATNLNCTSLKESNFENLEYKKAQLVNLIVHYNDCEGSETIVYNKMKKGASFNLSFRPGVTFSSLSIQKQGDEKIDFENNTGLRIGLEAEYILPFNNGKWSVFLEPTYRNYKAEKEIVYVRALTFEKTSLLTVEYNSIELPLGGRHYMFLNKNTAFFVDAAVILDVASMDSKIASSNENAYDLEITADVALGVGLGVKFKNKYSVQARLHTSRQLLNYYDLDSAYNSLSLIAGYNFL